MTAESDMENSSSSIPEAMLNSSRPPEAILFLVQQYTSETFWFSTSTVIALVLSYCVVIISGLIGNIFVILVVYRKKELRGSRNIYILNLSVCDVIMCSVCMPFSLVKLTVKKWTLGLAMCRFVPALATIDVFVSTCTILAIAIDRYMSIVHASQLTTRQVILVLAVIWTVSILLSTPLFCFHKQDIQKLFEHTFVQQCIDDWPNDLFRQIYATTVMLIQYLTPSGVISFLHASICKFLHYRLEERPGMDTQITAKAKADMKRHRRTMMLLTAMALAFSITWLPLTILNITADLGHEVFKEQRYNLLHAIGLLIAMSSSVANPLMYGWFNSNFRRGFWELLGTKENRKTSSKDNNGISSRKPGTFDISPKPGNAWSDPSLKNKSDSVSPSPIDFDPTKDQERRSKDRFSFRKKSIATSDSSRTPSSSSQQPFRVVALVENHQNGERRKSSSSKSRKSFQSSRSSRSSSQSYSRQSSDVSENSQGSQHLQIGAASRNHSTSDSLDSQLSPSRQNSYSGRHPRSDERESLSDSWQSISKSYQSIGLP
ncbi:neuropeptide Y receptor type 2 [Aplysia californica]|uniref:Neuropeptide Y receptor type 2 n=1 Tax=Aplysia californica TaxID=6500 RepID=A0ABM1VRZ9_APLCA|nr:neuropeptide Y receptor type 2 [Aplysia californica]XP_035825191.1 neuropeptide Y receptor type 2 [Aplysia californica]